MDVELCHLPAVEQRALLRSGQLSARELLQNSLERIEQVNPVLNAVVTLDPEGALRQATAADEAFVHREDLPPLHGLVMAHKDLLATGGMRTTWGCRLFADHVPAADAHAAARMAQAGAVRVGKTNVPEFGLGSHTVNPVFGSTGNPYAPDRSAGGSSGGAAAALASGMVSLADGGDMGGSLRNPASFCNVVGLRPPVGRVTQAPVERGGWPDLAVLGPMGRTVADTALLHGVLSGFDPADPNSVPGTGAEFLALAEESPRDQWPHLRVAWTSDLGGLPVDPEVTAVLEERGRSALERLGATVDDWAADFRGADVAFHTIRAWSVAGRLGPMYREHADLLGANLRADVEEGFQVTADDLYRAIRLQAAVRARVLAAFDHADVLAMPTVQLPPFPIGWDWPHEVAGVAQGHYLTWMRSCWYITLTGLPAISVPCGFTSGGLPVGLQLVGQPYGEVDLLRVAASFELVDPAGARRPRL
ncbi:amidase [Blastococcus sp. VKM Ac-2987]|uniref:amidase n=1 Tax=Blastococcus sp. VKM Ac-2987 TaxID=3004141 RepID=UPI0022AB52C8|nr:amidase family protein [Blastococcus sp. VKM Ac-2987]MCZ2859286.1 amidase family protein [Blastococcus sp. VKM Ac-2987]